MPLWPTCCWWWCWLGSTSITRYTPSARRTPAGTGGRIHPAGGNRRRDALVSAQADRSASPHRRGRRGAATQGCHPRHRGLAEAHRIRTNIRNCRKTIVILPVDFNIATQRAHSIDPIAAENMGAAALYVSEAETNLKILRTVAAGFPGRQRGAGKGRQEPECGPVQAVRGPHPVGGAGGASVLTGADGGSA